MPQSINISGRISMQVKWEFIPEHYGIIPLNTLSYILS